MDEGEETIHMLPSSGNFVLDWLTTEDGTLIIDGEEVEPVEDKAFAETQEAAESGEMTTKSSGLSAADWNVDYNAGKTWYVFWRKAWSSFDNFTRNGKSTNRQCDWWVFWCETNYVRADKMDLDHKYYGNSYGAYKRSSGNFGRDVDDLSHSHTIGGGVGAICYYGMTSDQGANAKVYGSMDTGLLDESCYQKFQ